MKKPWGGRFKEGTAKTLEEFSQSISFDRRLWQEDIEGSRAHAKMLCKQGIITEEELKQILKGLAEIEREIKEGKFQFKEELEDIHMNIERALIEKTGSAGAKIHTARSRNDQVATDLRLYLRKRVNELIELTEKLEKTLVNVAEKNIDTIMPGYTHLQKAQPVLLAHHLLAYAWMLERDRERLKEALKRLNLCPLGAGALAGSSLPIDRHYTAKELGFEEPIPNSMDAVSDRDFVLDVLYCGAMLMMHLSRLAEEIILWATDEFRFIELPDKFSTGSSMMPQKKNPDPAELIRGKTGRVYGNLLSMLTTMKGLPLTYNRDMQEDKEPVFDTIDTVIMSLRVITEMLPEIKFNKERMKEACGSGYITATDIAEYLVKKGVPFRNAHEITGKIVLYCIEKGKNLNELSIKELRKFSSKIEKDLYAILTPEGSIDSKSSYGSTSKKSVKEQIRMLRKRLKE
ncbi:MULTISPECIES: argininosuccinate lyase [Thermodesulfovibrio]|uniref:Argininosuccinate lyase n=1 Tax=Thermodesulfovibrio yellowstonii (strain ATCC 51303 / DSM 11347 / YP87) TaxID=289376 RepID=B5YJI1_THEYD|nr:MULTISPECIES: argininosuccinate lyase [Thermodesulfovibrio]ACI21748.1 argininosuccinate lyase [Thermodesulfovibrio yellowstonii DSM 11347]